MPSGTSLSATRLTTEPHDELHLGRDLVFAEVVCEVRQRVDVGSSAD